MTAERTCIACRTKAPRDELLRIVRGPDGAPALDFSGRLPGRGAHVCWSRRCLERAARPAVLARAFKEPGLTWSGPPPVEVARQVTRRRIGELCGLLQRSGALKSGAHTVRMALRGGWVATGLVARDASPDTAERFHRRCAAAGHEVVELPLTAEELGRAVGKGVRSVAVIGRGRLARELERALKRYRGLL